MKTNLVDSNLVCIVFGNNFLILIMVRTLEINYFLVRTKLGYLQYIAFEHAFYYHSNLLKLM